MKLEFEEKTLTVFPHANPLCKNEYLPTNSTDPHQIEHSGPIKEELTFDIFVKEEVKYTNVETVTREDLLNVNKIIPLTRRNISLGKANLVKSDENENSNENKSILKKSKKDVHQNESIKCDTIDVYDLVKEVTELENEISKFSAPAKPKARRKSRKVLLQTNVKISSEKIQKILHKNRLEENFEQKPKKLECPECPAKLKNEYNLKVHSRRVHYNKDRPNSVCLICGLKYGLKTDLDRHIELVHEQKKKFKCEKCHTYFGHSGHLNRHIVNGNKRD